MRRVVLHDPRGGHLNVEVAISRRERTRGLLGRTAVEPGTALLLPDARSVHTFGMRFDIRIALLDKSYRIVDVRDMPPRRIIFPRRGVRHVLECAPGVDLRKGDVLSGEQRADQRQNTERCEGETGDQ
jgi:hypothetical protein